MNQFIRNAGIYINKNLPAILMFTGVVTGLGTIGYSFYAGARIKELSLEMPEDTDNWTKVKKFAPVVAPIIVGATVSTACCIGAHKEHSKRYATLAGALALSQRNNQHLKLIAEKAQDKLSDKKANEVKEEVKKEEMKVFTQQYNLPATQRTWWHDQVTGLFFEATLEEILDAAHEFNKSIAYINKSDDMDSYTDISEFYTKLLGDRYVPAATHDDVIFGKLTGVEMFNPDWRDCETAPDMTMVHILRYDHGSHLSMERNTDDLHPWTDLDRVY